MNQFFSTFPRNVIGCFQGRLILWHLAAILFTCVLLETGFDWWYFVATQKPALERVMFPAAPIGMLIPVCLPLVLFLLGILLKTPSCLRTGWAIAQAELIGSFISSFYKALTGRVHPPFSFGSPITIGPDVSHGFRFGLLHGGVFWGWPSSHTTIAFAMAVCVSTLLPKQRWIGILAIIYASYIGLGVSMNIHWFSDFAAGVIIGSVIGRVVGQSFANSSSTITPTPSPMKT